LKRQDVDARVVFVGEPKPLAAQLTQAGIAHDGLGLRRGRHVVVHARRLARAVDDLGRDGALLIQPGFLAAALRAGGYRRPIVAVNHGEPLHTSGRSARDRAKRSVDAFVGQRAADVEVAVSDAVLDALRHGRHARRLLRIYNGVDLDVFSPPAADAEQCRRPTTVGWAGRLVHGKGLDDLVAAVSRLAPRVPVELRLAGDGPLRASLERRAPAGHVRFEGRIDDMATFWRGCDFAVMPSKEVVESFGMAAVEAMACGRPVVASRQGALPEIVRDGENGQLVTAGDVDALTAALERYARDSTVRREHGRSARRVCEERFDIRECAHRYRMVFESLAP
jgi:glycosyltransferase involved in cell wall biosynthesis